MISKKGEFENDDARFIDNFKNAVIDMVIGCVITREEANQIIDYHNRAKEETVYGEGLVAYLMDLQIYWGVVDADNLAQRLFILSVDWPEEYKIDFIEA